MIAGGLEKAGLSANDIAAVGVTNQRETTVVWDRSTRQADPQRDRLAGHAHRPDLQRAVGRRRPGPVPRDDGSAARDLLLGPEDRVDPRQRRRGAGAGRGRRPAVRQHRHLGDLEPHRRPERRRPRHRRDQRQPHDADGPADPRLGRRDPRMRSASRARCCPRSGRPPGVRRGDGRPGRHPGRRGPRRPAGGAVRPDLLRGRRGQEHLRHRLLPAAQHGHEGRAVQERPDHRTRLQDRRSARRLHARGLDRDHRRAGAVAARQPRADLQSSARSRTWRRRSTTTAASTSCRRSRACSRRTGGATRAA